ncbi:MAG: hypothetical protein ACM3RX_06510 [Methanococcaceae archaeon]
MKKLWILAVLVWTISAFGQENSVTLKAGYYFPTNLKSGAIFGLDYGFRFDESVSILFGSDFYYKSIRDDADLGNAEHLGIKIGQGERLSQWVGWHLPVTAKVRVEIPLQDERLKPYAIGGIGYGFTSISYDKFNSASNISSSSLNYNGFVWQLGGGLMFGLGSRSHLILEAIYNGANFDKDETANRFSTLNSSGFVLRAGVNFYTGR